MSLTGSREVPRYIGRNRHFAIFSGFRLIPDRIFLDHAATTPLRPEAKAAMEEGFRYWANPSSPHAEGRKARALLEAARERIKAALGWEGELIFTSGASEAAALALGRARGGRRIVSAVEHDCVLQAAPDALVLPVDGRGALDLAALEAALAEHTDAVVAIQSINSETGNCQDFSGIYAAVERTSARLIIDATQAVGKLGDRYSSDMVILSAHKFGGPIGVGALLVRDYAMLEASGGHERGYRRGTENLPGVLGMVAALECDWLQYIDHAVFDAALRVSNTVREAGGVWLSNNLEAPTGYIDSVAMPGLSATAQVMRFDMAGIAVSQGSACSSGTMKTSRVLEAMGIDPDVARRMIRISYGWNTSPADIERFGEVWLQMARAGA